MHTAVASDAQSRITQCTNDHESKVDEIQKSTLQSLKDNIKNQTLKQQHLSEDMSNMIQHDVNKSIDKLNQNTRDLPEDLLCDLCDIRRTSSL